MNAVRTHMKVCKTVCLLAVIAAFFIGGPAAAATKGGLEVSGWIPYWRSSQGARDARNNIEKIDEINPFVYTVTQDGDIRDQGKLRSSSWKRLFASARKNDVEIIPTVMWSDAAAMFSVLSNEDDRKDHVEDIARMVRRGSYDGVDIDYEGKTAETREYFSLFLKELRAELEDEAILSCTIEPRTPPDSLYTVVPATLEYSNDYKEINSHCDRIKLMTYDQGRADLKLNAARKGQPYSPVADPQWVEKVIVLALKDFPAEKVSLGVATYGYEYEVTTSPDWYQSYRRLWAFNPTYATDIADDMDITPGTNTAGEKSFTYLPDDSPFDFGSVRIPNGTHESQKVAAEALAYANKTGETVYFNMMWWSDESAIEDKIELAEKYNLRGISIFKIDGGEDKDIWDIL